MKGLRSLLALLLLSLFAFESVKGRRDFPIRTSPLQKMPTTSTLTPMSKNLDAFAINNIVPRGGAKAMKKGPICPESNKELFVKTLLNAMLEAAGLLAFLAGSAAVAPTVNEWVDKLNIPSSINGLSIIQWIACIFVIFSSSTVKTWIQGSVSAATSQSLKPNVVPGDEEWYANLKKPWFNPPGWAFPIMWLIVSKPTQLIAVSKILKSGSSSTYWPVLATYCFHLALGDAWNEVFFGCQRIGLGAIVISTFFGFLLASAKLFSDVDESAGMFLLPTCAWVFVATCLNLSIYAKNK